MTSITPQPPIEQQCNWSPDNDGADLWSAECGLDFMFNDCGPTANNFRYCPCCGDKINEVPWTDDEDNHLNKEVE